MADLTTGDRKTFDRQHQRVTDALAKQRWVNYVLGFTLLEMKRTKSWKAAGFESFHAYLDSLKSATRRTFQRYMAMAAKVPRAVAEQVDVERIEPALTLLGAPGETTVVSLEAIRALRIPVTRKGRSRKVAFDEALTEELVAAADARERAALPPIEKDAEQLLEEFARFLGRGPGSLGDVRLRRRGSRQTLVTEMSMEAGRAFLAQYAGRRLRG